MYKKAFACVALILFILAAEGFLYADSSYLYRVSGRVQLMESTEISMTDEEVNIKVMDGVYGRSFNYSIYSCCGSKGTEEESK